MVKRLLLALCALMLGVSVAQAQEAASDPAAVVDEFYTWYLDFIGTGEDFRNPLSERAYRDSDLLTPRFVAWVDEGLEVPGGLGYDPFLQAQDVPTRIDVGRAEIAEDGLSATVIAYTTFPKHMLNAQLILDNGRWLIDHIARGELATPEDVASSFYTRHLGWSMPAGKNLINPMVARTYQSEPLLTEGYIAEVDALLESWETEYGSYLADPFLCAQDIPDGFTIEEARYSEDGQTADVVVRTTFPGHALTLDFVLRDGDWLIDGITCGETRTPAGAAKSFYDWYLAYNHWDGEGERPNALVDGAYRDSALLTPGFVERVDEALAGMTDGGFDPFLCAQDVPTMVRMAALLEASEDSARLAVETSFEGHTFEVVMALAEGAWQIDDVLCQ